MNVKSRTEIEAMTKDEARAYVAGIVYDATEAIETLEDCGKIATGDHVVRRNVSASASREIDEHWIGPS